MKAGDGGRQFFHSRGKEDVFAGPPRRIGIAAHRKYMVREAIEHPALVGLFLALEEIGHFFEELRHPWIVFQGQMILARK